MTTTSGSKTKRRHAIVDVTTAVALLALFLFALGVAVTRHDFASLALQVVVLVLLWCSRMSRHGVIPGIFVGVVCGMLLLKTPMTENEIIRSLSLGAAIGASLNAFAIKRVVLGSFGLGTVLVVLVVFSVWT